MCSVVKEFCSENCLNEFKKKEEVKQLKDSSTSRELETVKIPVLQDHLSLVSGGSLAVFNSSTPCSFSLEDYLAETGSTAAPPSYFKQVSE